MSDSSQGTGQMRPVRADDYAEPLASMIRRGEVIPPDEAVIDDAGISCWACEDTGLVKLSVDFPGKIYPAHVATFEKRPLEVVGCPNCGGGA